MSIRQLHDLSRVYLESVAAKPDYLDFDKDGNKKEPMKKALKDKEKVTEAVRGQDTEMRKAASAERRAGDTLTKKLPPYKGKEYGKFQKDQISYIDKKTKGKHIVGLAKESLDPVGQEDADIDNDGKSNTKSDKYLMNRRKVRGAAIKKESFSNWRQDLAEVVDKIESDKEERQIKEKNINNKIVINPDFKEAVEEIGGQLIEMVEIEEGYQPIGKEKESAMYRRAGNLARTSLSSRGKKKEEAQTKSAKIVSAITKQKEKERFDRIGQSPAHNEEVEYVDEAQEARNNPEKYEAGEKKKYAPVRGERTPMPPRGNKKREDFEKWYAANVREENEEVEYVDEAQQSFPFKKVEAQKEKARKGSVYGKDTGNKPVPQVSDKEKKETTRFSKMQSAYEKAKRAKQEADKSRRSSTFYKDTHPASAPKMKKANEEVELDEKTLTPAETKKKEEIVKSMKKSATDFEKRYPGRGKEVMYATATKQAKKLAEAEVQDPAEKKIQKQQQQKMLQLLQQKQRAVRSGVTDISASYESDGEQLIEKQSALDIVRASVEKKYGKGSVMSGPTKKPKLTAAQKEARKKASDAYLKRTSQHLHSSPRD